MTKYRIFKGIKFCQNLSSWLVQVLFIRNKLNNQIKKMFILLYVLEYNYEFERCLKY